MKWEDLRIALVGPLPPPSGGMAIQTVQLAELLRTEGATVTLVQVNAPYYPLWVGRLRGVRALFRLLAYLARLRHVVARVQLLHIMANSGWSWHLFAMPAVWMARLRGIPVVVNYHGGQAQTFLARAVRWVRPTLCAAQAVAVPSGFLQEIFAHYGIKTQILPNIIDLSRFGYAARNSTTTPHLIIARNLEPVYDIPTALKAFAKVREVFPGARLSVAGSGPELANLTALGATLSIEHAVVFTGPLQREQMAALYRSADLMLNPSRVDNAPTSVLEALACGLPVVSTGVGGVPYIVRDGVTGFLVEVGDDQGMAAAAIRLILDAELRHRVTTAALGDARQYAWSEVRTRLAEIYCHVLASCEPRISVT